jgi:hypothetical protein
MNEKTYVLYFEVLQAFCSAGDMCRTRKVRLRWHVCSHGLSWVEREWWWLKWPVKEMVGWWDGERGRGRIHGGYDQFVLLRYEVCLSSD